MSANASNERAGGGVPPDATLTLTLKNDLAELARLAAAIEARGEARDWPPTWAQRAILSLDELITNVVTYGYPDGGEHEIHVALTERDDCLEVVMEDDGTPFDPFSEAPEPDLEADVDERRVGGLGVHIVKSVMDDVQYERRDGRNRMVLIQRSPK